MNAPLTGADGIAKGQDWLLEHYVLAPELVRLSANAAAGATSLNVEPLGDALAAGDMLLFGANTVVVLTSSAEAGEASLAVQALAGPLLAAERGQKIRDLTGYTIEFELLSKAGDATPVVSNDDVTVTVLTPQSETDKRGKVQTAGAAAVLDDVSAGTYFYGLWRTDAGSKRPLAFGDFEVVERGFL